MLKTFALGGINWCWYLQGMFNEEDKTVHVLFHTRWHLDRDVKHPKTTPGTTYCQTIEDGTPQRNLIEVKVGDVVYTVANPKNTFAYNDFTHLEHEG